MKHYRQTENSGGLLKVLLVGLMVAQAVATLQVRQSNLALHAKVQAVLSAGFIAVPGERVLGTLKTLGPAFWGGLFFTLSIGAALTLATMAAARLLPAAGTDRWPRRYAPIFLWALLLVFINLEGFDLYVNLYYLLIPPLVFWASRRWLPPGAGWRNVILLVLPVMVLALMWFSQFDRYMFIDIRDRLLLSNPVGQRINHFYYRYTLYPAEAFKSLSQKMIKTSRIDPGIEELQRRPIRNMLARNDWLPVQAGRSVDLFIRRSQNRLEWVNAGRVVLVTTTGEMASQTGAVLAGFSEKTDRYALFRQMSFFGLLGGFPILLYIGGYSLLRRLCGLLVDPRKSALAASMACLLIGIVIWGFFQHGRRDADEMQDIPGALAAENWRTRVDALRQCREKGIDVKRMPAYATLKGSPQVAVRYWLVEALTVSTHPHAGDELVAFLNDPSLNVRTRACAALGLRQDRRALPELLSRLNRSDEWYFQWYAYKAMKALGWRQNASD